jgi:transposase InsO family protein
MTTHPKAKLGLAGRHELVKVIESGESQREAARRCLAGDGEQVVVALAAGEPQGARLARVPRRSLLASAPLAERAPGRRAGADLRGSLPHRPGTTADRRLGRPHHSTVHATLRRHGVSRQPKPERGQVRRYEWDCPGDLLHMDTKRYARFERPGHAVTGDRSRQSRGAGYEYSHAIVDDHSRLAYAEILDSQDAEAVLAFTERALAFFASHGIAVRRLMTDNAWAYTRSRKFARLLRKRKIKHKRTRSRRPQTNGKVERFHQTMAREWGYGLAYRSSEHRRAALPHWLAYYNESRPHSSIGNRPPIGRVQDVSGQDI